MRRVTMISCGEGGGGMSKSVATLATALAAEGYQVAAGFPDNEWAQAHGKRLFGRTPQVFFDSRVPQRGAATPGQHRKLLTFLQEHPSDVVVIHEPFERLRLRDMLMVRMAVRRPLVVAIHAQVKVQSPLKRVHQRLCSIGVDGVIVATDCNKGKLAREGVPTGKISVVRYGIPAPDDCATREEARGTLGVPEEAFVVGCVARLDDRKRVSSLVRAFMPLARDMSTAMLLIAGDGPDRSAMEQTILESGNTSIRLLGFLSNPSLLYSAIDVFVLPSIGEAFGMVYIEAAHHGVPSIGVRDGGVPEAILDGRTGLLVEPGDEHALTGAMTNLKEDRALRERLGKEASHRAEREYSPKAMACGYARVIDSVLSERRRT